MVSSGLGILRRSRWSQSLLQSEPTAAGNRRLDIRSECGGSAGRELISIGCELGAQARACKGWPGLHASRTQLRSVEKGYGVKLGSS